MKTCIIFCAGGFDRLIEPIMPEDFVLAADGGLSYLEALGITPNGMIGDFDSLGYVPQGAQRFPVEKDDTDAMLAVREGLRRGYTRFVLYGSLDGPRLDHTVANFQVLQYLADRGATGYCVGKTQIATVIKNGQMRFSETAQGIFSVFCMGAEAKGVTLRGLQYEMEKGCLTAGFPLGVSNRFVGKTATVGVEEGSLLLLFEVGLCLPIS